MRAESSKQARMIQCRKLLGLLALGMLLAVDLGAQINDEINAGLQFDFSPPGARSLALGRAFTGLVDDATAAYTNPAGLLWLTRPEISFESRYRSMTTRFPDTGSASGSPTGIGLDTEDSLHFGELDRTNGGVGFLSYVGVPSKRWRWSVYRHELARFEASIESQGPFIRNGIFRSRLAAISGELELGITGHGLSLAYAATDRLWVGGGLSLYDFRLDAETDRYLTVDPTSTTSLARFDKVEAIAANKSDRHEQSGDDQELAVSVGVLWRSPGDHWSWGAVYRQGPSFDMAYRFEWGARRIAMTAGDLDGDGVVESDPNLDRTDPGLAMALSGQTRFSLPDVASLGVAWRHASLTVSLQVDHVAYSDTEPKANIQVNGLVAARSCGDYDPSGNPQPLRPCIESERLAEFVIEDSLEWHLGIEYVILNEIPLALRAGAWLEPDHRLTYQGDTTPPGDRFATRFLQGDDELHLTGGLGAAFKAIQVDLAADISDLGETFSLSAIYQF